MSPDPLMSMVKYGFHLAGLLLCLVGLSLAHYSRYRWPGRVLAGGGFLLAASPTLYRLLVGH